VGESGCGKTTAGYSALKLVPATGEVLFDDKDLMKVREDEMQKLRQHIQFVFQDPFASLNPRRTIGASIAEPLVVHHMADKARQEKMVGELLERVGIPARHASRYPHEFSGGQRQRVAIARAMILRPKLVVLDEPTSALDMTVQVQIVELLRSLQRKWGLAYIFISHDLRVVRALSHKVIVMKEGDVVEQGTQVFDAPREAYTRALLAAAFGEVGAAVAGA
jgi:ABC-type microcin C transport system duplicated ATPase subunit YejF